MSYWLHYRGGPLDGKTALWATEPPPRFTYGQGREWETEYRLVGTNITADRKLYTYKARKQK